MVLFPNDESPLRINDLLYKTKHKAKFTNTGMSFGFVFRRVNTTSLFDSETNCWDWTYDDVFRDYVEKKMTGKKHQQKMKYRGDNKEERVDGFALKKCSTICT